MRRSSWLGGFIIVVALCGLSNIAFAEGAPPPPPGPGVQPAPAPAPGPAPEQPPVTEETATSGRGIEYGAHIFVPVPVHGQLADLFGPGLGINGRAGYELPGGLSLELNIGYLVMTTPVAHSGAASATDVLLASFYVGGGGRFAFLNPSPLVPFVGAGVALNFWGLGGKGLDTGSSYTSSWNATTFQVNGLAGLWYEITEQASIEAGVQYNLALNRSNFDSAPGGYLSFFLGGTLYY